eukprot:TRINITY_DN5476_c0_g1_i1.p1 TRINITY_DN5476_c0_g1~~TRINITY_DN5476_c0_g1_i1.p1  ORF type:complete len:238 (+),score=12.08 TRINITY_DN5476_c0_g1_i1:570-1283(+)
MFTWTSSCMTAFVCIWQERFRQGGSIWLDQQTCKATCYDINLTQEFHIPKASFLCELALRKHDNIGRLRRNHEPMIRCGEYDATSTFAKLSSLSDGDIVDLVNSTCACLMQCFFTNIGYYFENWGLRVNTPNDMMKRQLCLLLKVTGLSSFEVDLLSRVEDLQKLVFSEWLPKVHEYLLDQIAVDCNRPSLASKHHLTASSKVVDICAEPNGKQTSGRSAFYLSCGCNRIAHEQGAG